MNSDPKPTWKSEKIVPLSPCQEEVAYQDDNPKTVHGEKKAPLHLVPPVAFIEEAKVFALGAKKYGPYNWRERTVSSNVYYAAALRHLMAWWDGEDIDTCIDPETGEETGSGVSHLAHVRACMAILLDADSMGRLNDNRPPAGKAGTLVVDGSKG